MLKQVTRFCKDCYYFEDRRDIDGTVLCAKNHIPGVWCEDFKPRDESINENRLYNRFCSECAYFEDVNGTPVCAKNHTPGVACEDFVDRIEKLTKTCTQNRVKVTQNRINSIIEHYINNNPTKKSRKNTQAILMAILRNNQKITK